MESLSEYLETRQLVDWAKANLDIAKLDSEMTDEDRLNGEFNFIQAIRTIRDKKGA